MPTSLARKIFLDRADRLQRMPIPSGALAESAARLRRRGVEVIDLTRLAAASLPGELESAVENTAGGWRPASGDEIAALREAVADWYDHRFGVHLDPAREIAFAPNTIMALHLLANAFLDTGELALIPDPGAPFYRGAIVLCGGGVVPYHLLERNDYLPSFAGMEAALVGRTRLFVLGYPHNPTAAAADLATLTRAVAFAKRHNILVAYDGAFTFASQGAFRPRTLLEASGAKGVGVELCAIGTNFGLPAFPLTVACGNREAISALGFLTDAAQLRPTAQAVTVALHLFTHAEAILGDYAGRLERARPILAEAAVELGWIPRSTPTAPFLWMQVPAAGGVDAFCRRILRRTGILMTPGTAFGECGEGYVRMVLPATTEQAQTVADRLRQHARIYQRRVPRRRIGAGRRRIRRGRKADSEGNTS